MGGVGANYSSVDWLPVGFMHRNRKLPAVTLYSCRFNPIYRTLCQRCCSHTLSGGSESLLSDGWTVGVYTTHFCNFPTPTSQQSRPLFTATGQVCTCEKWAGCALCCFHCPFSSPCYNPDLDRTLLQAHRHSRQSNTCIYSAP